jgi:hypothetical protein
MGPSGTYPPSAPLNLSAMAGDQQITLTWNLPSFDGGLPITNYRIYRGTAPGGEIFYAQIGSTLTFPDMGLTNGQMYCYRVSAVNGIGEGPLSNEACATPTSTPGAPIILQADLSGLDFENVTVRWSLSSDDKAGQRSVVGYEIHRNLTYDSNGLGYLPVAFVPNGTTELVDTFVGEGDSSNYFYQICAVDLNDLTNCSANQAGKFTRPLLSGPNLVSIPLIQSEDYIETALQTVKWDKAWTYDSSAQKWISHVLYKPWRGELQEANRTVGIWVNVTEQSNFTVAGLVPLNTTINLHKGWNLVGYPSFRNDFSVADLKAMAPVASVEDFDGALPPYFLRHMLDADIIQTGRGYWIEMASDADWSVGG